jgi:monoamine oxidase
MAPLSRRTFLHTTALAGAGAFALRCGRAATPAKQTHDVAILGAGMAGLAAARALVQAGLDIVILEASDRVGGRMQSLKDPAPHGLEIGAQMIHGSRATTWSLVHEFGLKTRPLEGGWSTARWVPGRGFQKSDPALRGRLLRRLQEAYGGYRGDDITYQQFLDDHKFTADEKDVLAYAALTWSAEPDEVSLQAAMEDEAAWDTYVDMNYQIIGGYRQLYERMGADAGERVRLKSLVKAVDWSGDGVLVTCDREGTTDTVRARRAIVTLPIGILQTGQPVFSPALPGWKRRAIDVLPMGRVVVASLLFDDWFWHQPPYGVQGWSMRGGRVSFWDPHPPGKGMPGLQGWITGRPAQELSDLGQDGALQKVLEWIEEACPKSNARKRLQWSQVRDWVRDPYTLGSYSYTRPGAAGQRAVLATPIQDRLYFAGEATEPAPHYQTVHGAYNSGGRTAREILSSLGMDVAALLRTPAGGAAASMTAPAGAVSAAARA